MEPTIHSAQRPALRRPGEGRMVAGVCAGLADYFDVDVVLVRVAVVVLAVMAGVGVPLYLAAWLLIPEEDADESIAEQLLEDAGVECRCTGRERHWTTRVHHRCGGNEDAQAS